MNYWKDPFSDYKREGRERQAQSLKPSAQGVAHRDTLPSDGLAGGSRDMSTQGCRSSPSHRIGAGPVVGGVASGGGEDLGVMTRENLVTAGVDCCGCCLGDPADHRMDQEQPVCCLHWQIYRLKNKVSYLDPREVNVRIKTGVLDSGFLNVSGNRGRGKLLKLGNGESPYIEERFHIKMLSSL